MNTNDEYSALQVTRLGLYANLSMGIVKAVGGWALGSQALTADGYHSAGDAVADLTAMAAMYLGSSSASSKKYSLGFAKPETIATLIIGGIVLVGGLSLGFGSASSLWSPNSSDVPGAENLDSSLASFYTTALALLSIAVKECVYASTMKVARRTNSSVLAANAEHHRLDSFTTAMAIFVTVCSYLFPQMHWLDPCCGLVVALLVLKGGGQAMADAVLELLGRPTGTKSH